MPESKSEPLVDRLNSPLRKEYYEVLTDQGLIQNGSQMIKLINAMTPMAIRAELQTLRTSPVLKESKYLVASSLEDIAGYFETIANREESKSTERTQRAQAYRNGQVQAYRDCAASMRLIELRIDFTELPPEDTGAAPRRLDGNTHETPEPPKRVFALGQVSRADAGGVLWVPVDQHGRESGDAPSYNQESVRERCKELNDR